MMRTELLKGRFDSLEDYEKFAAEWTEVCCMVNQNSRNMGNRERFKKIVEIRKRRIEREKINYKQNNGRNRNI